MTTLWWPMKTKVGLRLRRTFHSSALVVPGFGPLGPSASSPYMNHQAQHAFRAQFSTC